LGDKTPSVAKKRKRLKRGKVTILKEARDGERATKSEVYQKKKPGVWQAEKITPRYISLRNGLGKEGTEGSSIIAETPTPPPKK